TFCPSVQIAPQKQKPIVLDKATEAWVLRWAERRANREFSDRFLEFESLLEKIARKHPDDEKIWGYLAKVNEIKKRPGKALRTSRQAETACKRRLHTEADKYLRASIEQDLRRIRQHLAALER